MKKKLVLAMMVATMTLSMAACGEKNTDASVASTVSDTEISQEGEESKQEETQETDSQEASQNAAEEEFSFATSVPSKYMTAYDGERGTIEAVTYMAKDYLGDGEPVEKKAYVYLPAGYDESKQYNVIYLMHGIGGSEEEWGLGNESTSRLKKILDNMIGNGDVEPFIVVTPNGKAMAFDVENSNDYFYLYGYEMKNDLIPYIEGHYSTYANFDENGYDLSENRQHRAMAGLSMGGMQTINVGICESLDTFSYFGAFSAAPTSYPATKVAECINNSEYTIDYFYNICGTEDNIAYASASAAAKNLTAFTDKMEDGVNFTWQEKSGGHDFGIWYLAFYNFARVAFTK